MLAGEVFSAKAQQGQSLRQPQSKPCPPDATRAEGTPKEPPAGSRFGEVPGDDM